DILPAEAAKVLASEARGTLGILQRIRIRHGTVDDLVHILEFAGAEHTAWVGRQYLFQQGRARARHPDDEDWRLAGWRRLRLLVEPGKKVLRKHRLQALEHGVVLAFVPHQRLVLEAVALFIGGEGFVVAADVFVGFSDRKPVAY